MPRRWREALRDAGLLHRPVRAASAAAWVLFRYGPSLYSVAAWSALRFPHAPAVVDERESVAYRELVRRADAAAQRLSEDAAGATRVGLLCRNHVPFVVALLATQRLGLTAVLLNTTCSPQQTLEVARRERLSFLIVDGDLMPALRASDARLRCGAVSVVAAPSSLRVRAPHRGTGRIVLLTSGTTGPAQVVKRRVESLALLRTMAALLRELPLRAGASTLLTVPAFHGHGLAALAASLALGGTLHVFRRGSAPAYWQCLRDARIEVLVLVPTVLHRLMDVPGGSLPDLRAVVTGSAPLSAALARRALARFGAVLFNMYGTSEHGSLTLATPLQLVAAPASVGKALPGVRLRVRRDDGSEAAPGEDGSVVVGQGGAWSATGDRGCFNASGWLSLSGRDDDILNCGGESVSPRLIEERIEALPYVRECAVAGEPSEEYGQRVVAFVVPDDRARRVTSANVLRDLERLLPRTFRPARVVLVTALPRNAAGKLVRRDLGAWSGNATSDV